MGLSEESAIIASLQKQIDSLERRLEALSDTVDDVVKENKKLRDQVEDLTIATRKRDWE